MPTKRNSAGYQQDYVPKGHGEASGEYADFTGSNVHFFSEEFKRREEKLKYVDEKIGEEKFKEIHEKMIALNQKKSEIKNNSIRHKIFYTYDKKSQTFEFLTEDEAKEQGMERWDLWNYNIMFANILDKEQADSFFDANLEYTKLLFEMHPDLTEDEMLENMPSETLGMYELINRIGLVDEGSNKQRSWLAMDLFNKFYGGEKFDDLKEQTKNLFNERRIKLGSEYLEKNFKKGEPKTMDDALKLANPNYHMGSYFQTNCQRCSFVYEMLRRGYEAEAKPNTDEYGRNHLWMAQMVFKEKHEINAGNYKSLQKKVFDVVKKAGNGARFCISCSWKGSSGHAFVIENVDGEIVTLDAQDGSKNVDYYFEKMKSKAGVNLLRMDNADFTGSVAKTAFPLKEKKINFIQRGKEND